VRTSNLKKKAILKQLRFPVIIYVNVLPNTSVPVSPSVFKTLFSNRRPN
jgi:hypothetical protein